MPTMKTNPLCFPPRRGAKRCARGFVAVAALALLALAEGAARADEPSGAVPVASVCPDPGPKPTPPTCQRYTSSRVVRGGKVQTVQSPNDACIAQPGWAALDLWAKVSAEKAKCEKELCAGKPSWELCREKLPSEVECAGGRRQTVSCVGVKPPWREGTGEMVSIPAGTFQMGSNDGDADERPVHEVSVAAFQMDVTEVTVDAYAACVRAGSCAPAGTGEYCNGGEPGKGNHPINCVDWNQATAYCGWAKKRLPTEEEWEYAARGTDGRKYPWGNGAPGSQLCWKRWESSLGTCAVGDYKAGASPFGVLDLAGNVWEWTSSGYSNGYSNSRANGTRVNRGGGWHYDLPSHVRAADRHRDAPTNRSSVVGFRCSG